MPSGKKAKGRRSIAYYDVGARGRATGLELKNVARDEDNLASVDDFFEMDDASDDDFDDEEFDDKLEDSVMPTDDTADDFEVPDPTPAAALRSSRSTSKKKGATARKSGRKAAAVKTPKQTTPIRAIDFTAGTPDTPEFVSLEQPDEPPTPHWDDVGDVGDSHVHSVAKPTPTRLSTPDDGDEDGAAAPGPALSSPDVETDPTPTTKQRGSAKPKPSRGGRRGAAPKGKGKAAVPRGGGAKGLKKTPAPKRPALADVGPSMTPAFSTEAGIRRSSRNRLTPCAYWKNERVVYERAGGGVFKAVTKLKPPTPAAATRPQPKRKRADKGPGAHRRKQTRTRPPATIAEEDDEEASDNDNDSVDADDGAAAAAFPDTEPCLVQEWRGDEGSTEDFELMLAKTRGMMSLRPVGKRLAEGEPCLRMCKAFNVTEERWAAGLLEVPAHAEKPKQATKSNFLVFFVASAAIEATIHESTFRLNKGSMFFVPPGNLYSLKNPTEQACKLSYMQVKI